MNELLAGWWFALLRLRASWRLMAVAALGVVVAATLLAVAPIYAQSMSDLGLRFRLERGLPTASDRATWLEVDHLLIGDPVDVQTREAIDRVTAARVGWLAAGGETITEERSGRLDLGFVGYEAQAPEQPVAVTGQPAQPVRQNWGAFLYSLSNFEQHVHVTAGRLPGPSANGAEVVLPAGFQKFAAVGDQVRIAGPGYDDCQHLPSSDDPQIAQDEVRCRPTLTVTTSMTATVVGFVAPNDPQDQRWQLFDGSWQVPDAPFLPRLSQSTGEIALGEAQAGRGSMPLLTTRDQYFGAFAQRLPELPTRHRAGFVDAPGALALRDVPRAIADLHAWRSDVGDTLGLVAPSHMPVLDQLEQFRNTQTFSQVPLLLILLQVVGIVIYYVAVVMGLLLERQAEEVGVYRSRGASTSQIVGLTLIEGLVMAVPAAVVGPWLAAWLVGALGRTPTFHAITGGASLPVRVPPDAPLLAAGGAALALVAMLLPALVAARRGIVDVKREQSRPAGRGLVQRYYLDLAIVAFAVLLVVQLRQRGSVYDPNAVGGWSADPLLLLSPLVITLAVAALVLRFYPPLLRIAVRGLLLLKGTAVALGLQRAGRSPTAYARLLLLLVMAIAVGTFAASYGPTVDRSLAERIRYEAGADVRGTLVDAADLQLPAKLDRVRGLPGVADAAVAYRGAIETPSGAKVPLLAVDPQRVASMLWFRGDFSQQTLGGLARQLQSEVPPGGGLALPDDAQAVRVQVYTAGDPGRDYLQAILRDGDGHAHLSGFDTPTHSDDWETLGAQVLATLPRPVTFVGLRVNDRLGQNLRTEGALYFDNVAAVRPGGKVTVLDDFEGPFRWTQYTQRDVNEPFTLSTDQAASGTHSAKWQWQRLISPRVRVLALQDPTVPLAAVMNQTALGLFGTAQGRETEAVLGDLKVPLDVRATSSLFPTLDPAQGFVVVSLDQLRALASTVGFKDGEFADELWLNFQPGFPLADQKALVQGLTDRLHSPLPIAEQVLHQEAQLDEVAADPTLQASGTGILALAFVSVLGLCTLGFVVTLVLGARHRVIEFAVLRAVGSSGRQILRAMLLEWGSVLLIGGAIGVLLGRRVAGVMLSFLNVTDQGARVLPPFILETDWPALALGVGFLTVAVLVGLWITWAAAMRRANAATLRITQ